MCRRIFKNVHRNRNNNIFVSCEQSSISTDTSFAGGPRSSGVAHLESVSGLKRNSVDWRWLVYRSYDVDDRRVRNDTYVTQRSGGGQIRKFRRVVF